MMEKSLAYTHLNLHPVNFNKEFGLGWVGNHNELFCNGTHRGIKAWKWEGRGGETQICVWYLSVAYLSQRQTCRRRKSAAACHAFNTTWFRKRRSLQLACYLVDYPYGIDTLYKYLVYLSLLSGFRFKKHK